MTPGLVRAGLVAATIAAMTAFAGLFLTFERWVERSPAYCESCHLVMPEIAVWAEGEHPTLPCQDCHTHAVDDGLRILNAYVSGGDPDPDHGAVEASSCKSCHERDDPHWPARIDTPGHRAHIAKEHLACTECHGRQMHFNAPSRETCVSCHDELQESCRADSCTPCHEFDAGSDGFAQPGGVP